MNHHPEHAPDAPGEWVDFVECDVPDAVDLVVEVASMMSVFAAQQLERVDAMRREALADAFGRGAGAREIVERGVRLELAAALRVTEHAAGELISRAESLVHRYPQMLAALSGARTTERHAAIFVDAMIGVEPEFADRIVPRAVELAESESVGPFRRSLRKLIETVRSETLDERHEAALEKRRVIVDPADDGMAWLSAFLPAVEARAIHSRVTAMAKAIAATDDEARSLDQIRADVLGDLLVEGETTAVPAVARGIRASVAVTVPALALLDHVAAGAEPPVVEGVGPIPLRTARDLCAGADGWMRILTHPETGAVLSVGRDQYRPPPGLRKIVKWRADRCMAPGCGMPASRCEIDHTIAWEHGGSTSLENLAPICKGHHIVKHHGGWAVRQIDESGGALEWTSPSGRRYRVEPERRVPTFRPAVHGGADPPC
ncbi:HNH endonuclease signature motif containing protein [Microbacterium sulfonylureivorans]|uniref:HNH endonuclease signature motif containing protein n=1 Tax=Microbacterium sulfonylureivorans TaxID=2486854 RepID=UPI001F0C71A3|nr:HNH endonuclease signature motif containing protein [Microbacterium sulfonylureivorans]